MRLRCRVLFLTSMLAVAGLGRASSEAIYDEKADAPQQVAAAIAEASRSGRRVILIFGANWCPDCRVLDAQMHKPELASVIEKDFVIAKVDVGRIDKNVDLARKYSVPIRRGIPAMAVLDPQGKLLYAQDQGQFANARRLSFESIKAFFEQWKPGK